MGTVLIDDDDEDGTKCFADFSCSSRAGRGDGSRTHAHPRAQASA